MRKRFYIYTGRYEGQPYATLHDADCQSVGDAPDSNSEAWVGFYTLRETLISGMQLGSPGLILCGHCGENVLLLIT